MGAGTDWICSVCHKWFKFHEEKPSQPLESERKWVCQGCRDRIRDMLIVGSVF